MSSAQSIPDQEARAAAETTFDRNIVVIAGAGTGKTTLLVNRLVHLLMKEPRPVPVTQVVALTFTNKAATEMKVRLRERLALLADLHADGSRTQDDGAVSAQDLQTRYGLTRDEIAARAQNGLKDIEKAQIGTLHSFAAHLLRLHPLESGVDPDFQEDDGLRFDEHFAQAWDLWIDRELSRQGTNHERWRRLLTRTTVEDIRHVVYSLCSELIDLPAISSQVERGQFAPAEVQWIGELRDRAQTLLNRYDRPKRRKIEDMLQATVTLTSSLLQQGGGALNSVSSTDQEWLEKKLDSKVVSGWDEADYRDAKSLVKTADEILSVDHAYFSDLLALISPLVSEIRASFADKGWLSFDGLLARARALLHEHPHVRERIKRDYRALLVDEFQDTDPVQYEIILAVSEQLGRHDTAWQHIVLEPGKLFIVGDPKQSIYAFRRADIEAFDRVVDKITADGGMVQTLTTNFRSDAAVLAPINEVFDRLFLRRSLVQPANVRLEVRPQRRVSAVDPGVQMLMTVPLEADAAFDADGAVRAEGEVLARWLKEDVLARPNITAGQVALLFRKLTQADAYLDALRRYDIPYVIEGEKHFYRRQEVIDLVNVLRVLDHPHDRIALTGLLRSPLGGLTDRELFEFHEAGLLDYLAESRLDSFAHPRAESVRRLYGQLAWLHREVPAFPLADAIQLIFDRLPILEIAAASLHGEQAVANLLKVKQTAAALSDRAHLTLSGFVELMIERLEEQPEEAESPLAEESSDAVQILTIHKAKGLEFPVVVLPGLHQGSGRERATPPVVHDWSSGIYGLSLGKRRTMGAVLAREKFAVREEAERRRVLYVGMTRAKDLLVLSGGKVARTVGEATLDWLQEIGQGTVGEAATDSLQIGASTIPHRVIRAPDRKWQRRPLASGDSISAIDPSEVARLWGQRKERWIAAGATEWRLTPTAMARHDQSRQPQSAQGGVDREIGRLAGVAAHRILQSWNFATDPSRLMDRIGSTLRVVLGADQQSMSTAVRDSLQDLFAAFGRSELYGRLRSSQILGREVPFIMPWGERQVMEGVIDLIYRFDGELWVLDYKTDVVSADQAAVRAEQYRMQSDVYKAAVKQSLGDEPRFHCLFLRCGVAIEL
jgi:ATP-dependent helicase/nuclease subunit A